MHWNDERDERLIESMESFNLPHSWPIIAAFCDSGDPKYLEQFRELVRTGTSFLRNRQMDLLSLK